MKRSRLILLVCGAVALALAVVVGVFYGIENWRGKREWERVRRELAAQGESLDPAKFLPPPVQDEQNLALLPLFARALDYRTDPQTGGLIFGPNRYKEAGFEDMPYGHRGKKPPSAAPGGWEAGQPLAMEVLQRFYAGQADFPQPPQPGAPSADVLLALTKFTPALEEIEAALPVRTQARFPVRWNQWPPAGIVLAQDNLIQKLVSTLRLRTLADLDAGRHAEALRDLTTAFRVRDAIRSEPTLIAHLVIITCDGLLLQPIWEGLAARRWTADELRDLQRELRADDLLAGYVQAMRGERAIFFCRLLDGLRASGNTRELGPMWNDGSEDAAREAYRRFAALYPQGWIDRAEANVCLAYQEIITGVVDLPARRFSVAHAKALRQRWGSSRGFVPWEVMTKLVMPVMESVSSRMARAQTACEQAEVACALERYFLANGAYPPALDALVPGFIDRIPVDLIAGGPMRYRQTEDGRYLLYGIGWNERDEGGTVAWTRPSNTDATRPDREEGDWVWQYQPVSPPVR